MRLIRFSIGGGKLGAFDRAPTPDAWILEIQMAYSSSPYGALYEDLLI